MRECVQNQWRRKEGARPPAERERYAIIVKVKGVKKKEKKGIMEKCTRRLNVATREAYI
jgi:hypothetical protein